MCRCVLTPSMADRLFLIEPGFEDPACSASAPAEDGTLYHCPECLPLEGLIALYPQVFADLDVVRVPYQRPRHDVVEIFGEENQGLPKLLLDDRESTDSDSVAHPSSSVVEGLDAIVKTLCQRYDLPTPHC